MDKNTRPVSLKRINGRLSFVYTRMKSMDKFGKNVYAALLTTSLLLDILFVFSAYYDFQII